jgi:hypothetical protein
MVWRRKGKGESTLSCLQLRARHGYEKESTTYTKLCLLEQYARYRINIDHHHAAN